MVTETQSYKGNNYWGILNKDSAINRTFSVLYGAGRCSHVYFPLILKSPKYFENLEVLCYINPTYWRLSLNNFDQTYFNRYVDSTLVYLIQKEAQALGIYEQFMKPVFKESNSTMNYKHIINYYLDDYKSFFYYDLDKALSGDYTKESMPEFKKYYTKEKIEAFRNKINLEYNATDEFLKLGASFPVIDTASTFQYEMLSKFIMLCKKYNIRCTFYLGPYNEIYCKKKTPKLLAQHRKVIKVLMQILTDSGMPFIDGSHLSIIPGTFIDVQHTSEYGGYLIANQLKEYYEKNY